jgi:hypothetical protein
MTYDPGSNNLISLLSFSLDTIPERTEHLRAALRDANSAKSTSHT